MKRLFLAQQYGENSDTAKDVCAYVLSVNGNTIQAQRNEKIFSIDLGEKCVCCLNSGDDRLVETDKYAIVERDIPEWMEPDYFISYLTAWKYFIGFGGKAEWGKQWFDRLHRMGESEKLACIKLLNTKSFRSPFRQSLRTQLEAWLNAETNQYNSPFSSKQWGSILDVYTCREARQRANSLYWHR